MKHKQSWFDVHVTRSLLDKNDAERSDIENEAIRHHKEHCDTMFKRMKDANDEIRRNCPILCSGPETTMIPSVGWIEPVRKFCYRIEELNRIYKKHGIKMICEQSKSKYAEIRLYMHMMVKPTGLVGLILKPLDFIHDRILFPIDYGRRTVEDECPKVTIEWEEIDRDQFEGRHVDRFGYDHNDNVVWDDAKFRICCKTNMWENSVGRTSRETVECITRSSSSEEVDADVICLNNTNVFREMDGKYYYAYELHHGPRTHIEITKHRVLFKLMNLLTRLQLKISMLEQENPAKEIAMQVLDDKTEELVARCERECENLCEECGAQISHKDEDEYNSVCVTNGWISYLCRRCAEADGGEYVRNGELWMEDKRLMDRDEYAKERAI